MSEVPEERWPPPLWVGWLLVSGAPIIGLVSWIFYREDGIARVLMEGWYAVVCLIFGIACVRAARSRSARGAQPAGLPEE